MPHPALGLPPSDQLAGAPDVAARLRGAAGRLPPLALAAAMRIDPTLRDRYDDLAMRRFLRDYEGHVERLALAVASGEDRHVADYAETLVPIYRRQHVRMNDVVTLVRGLEEASIGLSPAADADAIRRPAGAWVERLRHHRRLPGDHAGNGLARFIWKGAGLGDDFGRLMTIKWVKADPLVMNGEPFCYGTRLTVRNLLEMRSAGMTPADMLAEHPELRPVGIAEAFGYATRHRDRFAAFFEADGSLRGTGFGPTDAATLPEHLRSEAGVVSAEAAGAPDGPSGGRV